MILSDYMLNSNACYMCDEKEKKQCKNSRLKLWEGKKVMKDHHSNNSNETSDKNYGTRQC